jgi:hypothetical protein
MRDDYYSPITIAVLNNLTLFAIDDKWCCFKCGSLFLDISIMEALNHYRSHTFGVDPLVLDLRRKKGMKENEGC